MEISPAWKSVSQRDSTALLMIFHKSMRKFKLVNAARIPWSGGSNPTSIGYQGGGRNSRDRESLPVRSRYSALDDSHRLLGGDSIHCSTASRMLGEVKLKVASDPGVSSAARAAQKRSHSSPGREDSRGHKRRRLDPPSTIRPVKTETLSDLLPCPPRTINSNRRSFEDSIFQGGKTHGHSLTRPHRSSVDNANSRNTQPTEPSLSQTSGPQRLPSAPHVSVGLNLTVENTTKNKPANRQAALPPPNCGATGAIDNTETQARLQNIAGEPISGEDSSLSDQVDSFLATLGHPRSPKPPVQPTLDANIATAQYTAPFQKTEMMIEEERAEMRTLHERYAALVKSVSALGKRISDLENHAAQATLNHSALAEEPRQQGGPL